MGDELAKMDSGEKNQPLLELSHHVGELLGRLRLLEERYASVRREHQNMSHNTIENHQQMSKQMRKITETLTTTRRELADMNDRVNLLSGELADSAKIHEFKALERYINLWQPMDFLTRDEAQRLLKEARKVYKDSKE